MDFTDMSHEELIDTLQKVTSLLDGEMLEEVISEFTKVRRPLNHEAKDLDSALGITRKKFTEIASIAKDLVGKTFEIGTRSRKVEWLHLRWKRMSSVEKALVAVTAVEVALLFAVAVERSLDPEEASADAWG